MLRGCHRKGRAVTARRPIAARAHPYCKAPGCIPGMLWYLGYSPEAPDLRSRRETSPGLPLSAGRRRDFCLSLRCDRPSKLLHFPSVRRMPTLISGRRSGFSGILPSPNTMRPSVPVDCLACFESPINSTIPGKSHPVLMSFLGNSWVSFFHELSRPFRPHDLSAPIPRPMAWAEE